MISVPPWMDYNLFEDILSKVLKEDKNVEGKEVIVSIPNEESPTEGVYRSRIVYTNSKKEEKSISVIIKRLSPDKVDGQESSLDVRHSKSMSVEVDMHLNILPIMHRLLEVSGIESRLAPNLYRNINTPCDVLIMEDMIESGYETITKRFDVNNTERILGQLAHFHAASYFMAIEEKKDFSKFRYGVFNFGSQGVKFFTEGLTHFIKEALKWPELKVHCDKIRGLEARFMDARSYLYKTDSDYNVLNHGDFHMRNFMCKIVDNSIKHIIMHDFQTNVWCSPALDLIYTFYLIADSETNQNCRARMLSFYHKTFVTTLKRMGFMGQIPSLLDLNVELLRNGFIEIFVSISFLPYQFIPFASERLQERIAEQDTATARSLLYTIPEYQRVMKKLFADFILKGFLDA